MLVGALGLVACGGVVDPVIPTAPAVESPVTAGAQAATAVPTATPLIVATATTTPTPPRGTAIRR